MYSIPIYSTACVVYRPSVIPYPSSYSTGFSIALIALVSSPSPSLILKFSIYSDINICETVFSGTLENALSKSFLARFMKKSSSPHFFIGIYILRSSGNSKPNLHSSFISLYVSPPFNKSYRFDSKLRFLIKSVLSSVKYISPATVLNFTADNSVFVSSIIFSSLLHSSNIPAVLSANLSIASIYPRYLDIFHLSLNILRILTCFLLNSLSIAASHLSIYSSNFSLYINPIFGNLLASMEYISIALEYSICHEPYTLTKGLIIFSVYLRTLLHAAPLSSIDKLLAISSSTILVDNIAQSIFSIFDFILLALILASNGHINISFPPIKFTLGNF